MVQSGALGLGAKSRTGATVISGIAQSTDEICATSEAVLTPSDGRAQVTSLSLSASGLAV